MAMENRVSVLVVDDEESVRLYLKTILGKSFEVFLAKDGAEALDIASTQMVDLVLLDLILNAGEDGLSVVRSGCVLRHPARSRALPWCCLPLSPASVPTVSARASRSRR